ncbi:teneurin-3-like isoform X4 [Branchiostoma floridae]|uniref:Teneurin-3-like isoform X4 n=1 Tax=Branchiostoma floridae TaxID=7739 RepID=A0A9J7MVW1_BRAFL|nr:teneurin-3-like isoform X4 [Branchiostoma floridae]
MEKRSKYRSRGSLPRDRVARYSSSADEYSEHRSCGYSSDETLKAYEKYGKYDKYNDRYDPAAGDRTSRSSAGTDVTLTANSPRNSSDIGAAYIPSFVSGAEGDEDTDGENFDSNLDELAKKGYIQAMRYWEHQNKGSSSDPLRDSVLSSDTENEGLEGCGDRMADAGSLPSSPSGPTELASPVSRTSTPSPNPGDTPHSMSGEIARNTNYSESEDEFEGSFLVQTASGNVYVPTSCKLPDQEGSCRAQEADQTSTRREEPTSGEGDVHWAPDPPDRQQFLYHADTVGSSAAVPLPPYSLYPNERPVSLTSTSTFKMKRPYRCNWRCAAIVFMVVSFLLAALLAYFLAMRLFALNWSLQPDTQLVNPVNGMDHTEDPKPLFTPGTGTGLIPTRQPNLNTLPEDVITGLVPVGGNVEETVPPFAFWRSQLYLRQPRYIMYNVSMSSDAKLGIYARKDSLPTHTQFDFAEMMDGSHIVVPSGRRRRASEVRRQSGFVQYMGAGQWHMAVFNDGPQPQKVLLNNKITDNPAECPAECNGNGECITGICQCYPGYMGKDCAHAVCPVICSGNGQYHNGQCVCTAGYKGPDCNVPPNQCLAPDCSGHGDCIGGQCRCQPGWTGEDCSKLTCEDPDCTNHGICMDGKCFCESGWTGTNCEKEDNVICPSEHCSGHGTFVDDPGVCVCEENWTGQDCSQSVCPVHCGPHGTCSTGRCVCDEGWGGETCEDQACFADCNNHGTCDDGNCVCDQGWNGPYCGSEGCPGLCNSHGTCQYSGGEWQCVCHDGYRGLACDFALETACNDRQDNDADGLEDCEDPDCCSSPACQRHYNCRPTPDPQEILARLKRKVTPGDTFYDRVKFLVEPDSIQALSRARELPFAENFVSVLRGKVLTDDGSPLMGANITVVRNRVYGYTLSRQDGWFDIVVNGGGSLVLRVERSPFLAVQKMVHVPWNDVIVMEDITMTTGLSPSRDSRCDISGVVLPRPLVLPAWPGRDVTPCEDQGNIVPEIQALKESVTLTGTTVHMTQLSNRQSGYRTVIHVLLTPPTIPPSLRKIHLRVAIQGQVMEKVFNAEPNLLYPLSWDRTDGYGQPVYGVATAWVSVGFEYAGCSGTLWEKVVSQVKGYDITPPELAGWSLSLHHVYDSKQGIVYKGTGSNIYTADRPAIISTVMGTGHRRDSSCAGCEGKATGRKLLSPMALAAGIDGSMYVGDYNYVRRIDPDGNVVTIMKIRSDPPQKYYMAVDPTEGTLYVSDRSSHQIYRARSLTNIRNPDRNMELVAGTGAQCPPMDEERCGDGGSALRARLYNPKGIAVDNKGLLYFLDGTAIRMIDTDGIIRTILKSQSLVGSGTPLPCKGSIPLEQVQLQWPTALSISPVDNSLYILDSAVVLRVSNSRHASIVAGVTSSCQTRPGHHQAHRSQTPLESPSVISVGPDGTLYIAETDLRHIHQVRKVLPDGSIVLMAGGKTDCDCQDDDKCNCYAGDDGQSLSALLNSPSALAVTPDGTLNIADQGNLRVRTVSRFLPQMTSDNVYEVASSDGQELYMFNQAGQHQYTEDLVTGIITYNFTYDRQGRLSGVIDTHGNTLQVHHDARKIILLTKWRHGLEMSLDEKGRVTKASHTDGRETSYTYFNSTGLITSREDRLGWTSFYEYNRNGWLQKVVYPTGETVRLRGGGGRTMAMVDVIQKSGDTLTLTADHSTGALAATQGLLHSSSTRTQDGSTTIMYPDGTEVAMETRPHPLLGPDMPVLAKRKITISPELVNRVEWRWFVRRRGGKRNDRKVSMVGRRIRVGVSKTFSFAGQLYPFELKDLDADLYSDVDLDSDYYPDYPDYTDVNGINVLSLEYDREARSERIYDDHLKFMLTINYNEAGRPIKWVSNDELAPVNVSYDSSGRMTGWQWSDMVEQWQYDRQGRTSVRTEADGLAWSYTYEVRGNQKVVRLSTPGNREYSFYYDMGGHLAAVTNPSNAHHTLSTQLSATSYRNTYTAPDGKVTYIQDFNYAGQPLLVQYPNSQLRVVYRYGSRGELTERLLGDVRVKYDYDDRSGRLNRVSLLDGNNACIVRYHHLGPLIDRQTVRFVDQAWAGSKFLYEYDTNFRVTSVKADIGTVSLPAITYNYDLTLGKIEHFGSFEVMYYGSGQIVSNSNMTLTKQLDRTGRVQNVQYEIRGQIVHLMALQYNNLGNVKAMSLQRGTNVNATRWEFQYDADGQLETASKEGGLVWRYSHDNDGNIIIITEDASQTVLIYDAKGHIRRAGGTLYFMDEDGFVVRRDDVQYEYSSDGLLRHVKKPGVFEIWYKLDGLGRRVSRQDLAGNHVQYFYGDLSNPTRMTHVMNHSNGEVLTLHYDIQGLLFATESNMGVWTYVVTDHMGSPLALFNAQGQLIKEIQYSPYGQVVYDSDPSVEFVIGYHGGLYDPVTRLVHIGGREYDPAIARWYSPDHQIWKKIAQNPSPVALYQYRGNNPLKRELHRNYMGDVESWLCALGFSLHSVVPQLDAYGHLDTGDISCQRQREGQQPQPQTNQIIPALHCHTDHNAKTFLTLQATTKSGLVSPVATATPGDVYGIQESSVGQVVLGVEDGNVRPHLKSSARPEYNILGSVLNGSLFLEQYHFTINGKDVQYFVKRDTSAAEEDLQKLRLQSTARSILGAYLNASRHEPIPGQIEVRFEGPNSILSLQYGDLDIIQKRILDKAKVRGEQLVWTQELALVEQGLPTRWDSEQQGDMRTYGHVPTYGALYIRPSLQYPEMADDPRNIKLVPLASLDSETEARRRRRRR